MVTQHQITEEEKPDPRLRLLRKEPKTTGERLPEKEVEISYMNIHKKFGRNSVLNGLNLNLKTGRTIAVLGPNGSGKTTLIKSLLGMVLPD